MTNLMTVFRGVGCVTSDSGLDIGDGPDHDADTGIFKRNSYHCGIGQLQHTITFR